MTDNSLHIGIDVTQIQYIDTGVSRYVRELVTEVVSLHTSHTFVLLGVSMRNSRVFHEFHEALLTVNPRVTLRIIPFPVSLCEIVWNTLGVIPIDWLLGHIDVFWSSDWIQPPLGSAKGVTTIHDLSMYRFPESFTQSIVSVHARRLKRAKRFCHAFLCDSEATKKDAHALLGIPLQKLFVVYPGFFE